MSAADERPPGRIVRLVGPVGRGLRRGLSRLFRPLSSRPVSWLVAAAFAVLVLALGVGGLVFQLALPSLLPSALDWRALSGLLERDAVRGDAVLASPAWAERLRAVGPRQLPVLAQPRFTPAELEGVRRVWLVSLPTAPGFSWRPEIELLARSSAPDPALGIGRLEVRRFELTHPDLVLVALPDRLGTASAAAGDAPCTRERDGFSCSTPRGRISLERVLAEENGTARPCLAIRSHGGALPLALTFPGVLLGRELRGSASALGGAGPGPLTVTVRVDREEAGAAQLEATGPFTFRVDTGRWAGEKRSLTLELTVPEDRPLCLRAATLP